MSKHTPGPWVFESRDGDHPLNDQDGWGCDGLWAVDGGFILGAGPGWDSSYVAPDDADARLIAAAPELLEACKAMLACCYDLERNDETLAAVKTTMYAIAKATGEMP